MGVAEGRPQVSDLLASLESWAFATSDGPPRIGLEVESLVVCGQRAASLDETLHALEPFVTLDELLDTTPTGMPIRLSYGDIHLTFEPGGQIELVTPPRASVDTALEDIEKVERLLDRVLIWSGLQRANIGLNPWQTAEEIGLQTPLPRYRAMQEYFNRVGPDGLRMMRLTCALQVNVDPGGPSEAPRRWRLANLMSPVLIGTFANSPVAEGRLTGWKSERARAVHDMDHTRTGAHAGIDGPGDYLEFALDAGVLLRRSPNTYYSGRPGMTFRDWVRESDPWGGPTLDDWKYHLTTLFPQVRPRGFLELRSIDNPPVQLRQVPVAVVSALLTDERSREQAIELLEPIEGRLDEMTLRAAQLGPADPQIGVLGRSLVELSLDAMERLPQPWMSSRLRDAVCAFYDDYAACGRCPADDWLEPGPSGVRPAEALGMLPPSNLHREAAS